VRAPEATAGSVTDAGGMPESRAGDAEGTLGGASEAPVSAGSALGADGVGADGVDPGAAGALAGSCIPGSVFGSAVGGSRFESASIDNVAH
jgi:hypothetical protein